MEDEVKEILCFLFQRPQVWERLSKKYDPTGDYTRKYKDEADKRGIKL